MNFVKKAFTFILVLIILIATFSLPINPVHAQVQNVSVTKIVDGTNYKETYFVIVTSENTYHILVKANITRIGNETLIDLVAILLNPHNYTVTASAAISDVLTDHPYIGVVEAIHFHFPEEVVEYLVYWILPIATIVAIVFQVYMILQDISSYLLNVLINQAPFVWASIPYILLKLMINDSNDDDTGTHTPGSDYYHLGSFDLYIPYLPAWYHAQLVLDNHYYVATSKSWWEIVKYDYVFFGIVLFSYYEAIWICSRVTTPPTKISPSASFYWEPIEPVVGEEVTFISTSFDPDGVITEYHWWLGDDSQEVQKNFTHAYYNAGSYNVTLKVTDNDGLTSNVTHTITVQPRAIAKLRVIPQFIEVDSPAGRNTSATLRIEETLNETNLINVTLQATDLKSLSGFIISSGNITFNKNGITIPKGTHTSVIVKFYVPKNAPIDRYNGSITVSSENGGNTTIFVNLYVFGPPQANFTWNPPIPEVSETVTFDASSSVPTRRPITGYTWDFGDGEKDFGKIVTHAYTNPGNYTVTLNITDSEGLWDVEQKQIEVKAPPPPLKVSISPTSASMLLGQSVTFTSTVSGGYTPYTYQWYLNGNPVSGATSDTWTFTPTTSGIFYVYLKVTDDKGNTAQSDTARITVSAVPVGGYSIPINVPTTTTKAVTPYIALLTILTAIFVTIKRKTKRKH